MTLIPRTVDDKATVSKLIAGGVDEFIPTVFVQCWPQAEGAQALVLEGFRDWWQRLSELNCSPVIACL